jgi:hypothetical protein
MLIIQRSQIAGFSCFRSLAGWPQRPYIPSCAERGAGVGRSSTGRSYETARKGRSGKSTGVVDETATGSANFFGPPRSAARGSRPRLRSPRCTRHVRRASTRASSPSSGRPGSRCSCTSDCSPSERAVRRRSCSLSSPSPRSGSSSASAARKHPPGAAGAPSCARLRRPTARTARRECEEQLPRELAAELLFEPLPRGSSLWIEALEVCGEKPHPPLRPSLGEDCHPDLYIGGPTPLA